MQDIINIENGALFFDNKEYIFAKTTYEEILMMKGTINYAIDHLHAGIKSVHFHNKEINRSFYQISFCFDFEKLNSVFITVKDGKVILKLPFWKNLKRIELKNNARKTKMKRKNYDWGSVIASYDQKVNFGSIIINYKWE
ncbi:hypothetical protein [Flavobacterium sp.]|uniref:hypothetical protein n=1 Tax=Flavobacterium sp. TaxID=239 RepID=UPI00261B6B1E|nr:hypothetical protein [Flavobacterium sp.]